MELRSRVVSLIEEGHGQRAAARHLQLSPKFLNALMILKRENDGPVAQRQGRSGDGKLAAFVDGMRDRLVTRDDLTLDQIVTELVPASNPARSLR